MIYELALLFFPWLFLGVSRLSSCQLFSLSQSFSTVFIIPSSPLIPPCCRQSPPLFIERVLFG